MLRRSAAFFFSGVAPRDCVSCETTFTRIDIQDEMPAQRHTVWDFLLVQKLLSTVD